MPYPRIWATAENSRGSVGIVSEARPREIMIALRMREANTQASARASASSAVIRSSDWAARSAPMV